MLDVASADVALGKVDDFFIADERENGQEHCANHFGSSSKKLEVDLPCNTALDLLSNQQKFSILLAH